MRCYSSLPEELAFLVFAQSSNRRFSFDPVSRAITELLTRAHQLSLTSNVVLSMVTQLLPRLSYSIMDTTVLPSTTVFPFTRIGRPGLVLFVVGPVGPLTDMCNGICCCGKIIIYY